MVIMKTQEQQQQQQQQQVYNREEEYLAAQRAGAEGVLIGRETLEVVVGQGEQLKNAESMAEETEYKLDRAARLLRGMTWSGWLANKFTRDAEPPEYKTSTTVNGPPTVYEHVPSSCQSAAQAVQNYHANLLVLDTCETEEQKETLKVICNSMYDQASKEVKALVQRSDLKDVKNFPVRLSKDLASLRDRQLSAQQPKPGPSPTSNATNNSNVLFQGARQQQQPTPTDLIAQQQEEHLEAVGRHLQELNSIAHNLNYSISEQNEVMESLDGKSDSMLFKSKMVTRRADRLIQNKSWNKVKKEFQFSCSIRHVKSGKYLAVSANNGLMLSSKFNETCVFGVWKRQGSIFGLQSKYSTRWVGQNLLGNLVCSATSFDRREEWDIDEDWSQTPLLCASAGWGNGGYLLVRPDESIAIGGGGLAEKKSADLWCIAEKGEPARQTK